MRAFGQIETPALQFNCVSGDELKKPQMHPERHPDLQIRICGLSAYSVSLDRVTRDEIVGRSLVDA